MSSPKRRWISLLRNIKRYRELTASMPRHPLLLRFTVAVALALGDLGLKILLQGILGTELPFFLSSFVVFLSAWYGGLTSGLFTTLITGIGAGYWLNTRLIGVYWEIILALFMVEGLAISYLLEALHFISYQEKLQRLRLQDQTRNLQVEVQERRAIEEALRHRALHDTLTDLPNRTLLADRMEVALFHARRNQEKVAILFLDLDHFKNINDSLGHQAGDLFLIEVARRLKQCVREEDTVARFGGDEFLIMLTNVQSKEAAIKVARSIQVTLSEPFKLHTKKLPIKTSIGIAVYPEDGREAEDLVRNADAALYQAKEGGRNAVELFELKAQ